MITLQIYTGERLTGIDHRRDWHEAIRIAYRIVDGLPSKTVHVFPTGTRSGVFIVRHDDARRRGWNGIEDVIACAQRMEFS